LIFELGGIPERELEKLKAEAEALGKQSFAFAFYMDRQKEVRPPPHRPFLHHSHSLMGSNERIEVVC
jgi:hypothetical protein